MLSRLVHGISFDLVFLLRVQLGCALLLLFVGGMLLLFLIDDNRHGLLSLSMLDAMCTLWTNYCT